MFPGNKDVLSNNHSTHCQNQETECINKLWSIHTVILPGSKKERTAGTCNNRSEESLSDVLS